PISMAICAAIAGLESLTFAAQIAIGDGAEVDIELSHSSLETLELAAADLAATLGTYDGVQDIDDGFSAGKPQLSFRLEPTARSLGLTVADLASAVRSAFYGTEALRLQRGRNEVKVLVRLPEEERETLSTVENLMLRTPLGGEVPLFRAASVEYGSSYTEIRRREGKRSIDVTADVDETVTSGNEILAALRRGPLRDLLKKYAGLSYSLEGEQQTQRESLEALGIGFVLAMFGIFALLAIAFGSYVQPLIVMVAIPFGAIGGIAGHYLLGYNLNMISFFGLIALTGIVINDSLVLVVTANRYREEDGFTCSEAMQAAGVRRLRPILLTTITTVLGLTPMLLETSVQARFLIPMAISIAGGEMFSTVLLLGLVPALYVAVEDVQKGVQRCLHWIEPPEPSVEDEHGEMRPPAGIDFADRRTASR
ncbi:MAG: efflux RND transporter permease subunit, partial [Planctomycetes bacterium]|nr:efflux RND transporter permease subunit [Planctomycetota bacterium]